MEGGGALDRSDQWTALQAPGGTWQGYRVLGGFKRALLLHPHPARSARGQTEGHHLRLPWPHVSPCRRAPALLPRSQLPRSSCSRCLSASRRGSTAPAVTCTGTRALEAPGS